MRVTKYCGIFSAICAVNLWSMFANVATADDERTPRYRVDPSWPRPLPHDQATGKPWVGT